MPFKHVIVLCLSAFLLVACGDGLRYDGIDGDTGDGDMADGDMADGDVIDGDLIDGDMVDGDVIDGDVTDGDIDSDLIDGDQDGDQEGDVESPNGATGAMPFTGFTASAGFVTSSHHRLSFSLAPAALTVKASNSRFKLNATLHSK